MKTKFSRGAKYLLFTKARRELRKISPAKNPFFIIATTGTLHIVELCLKHFPENLQVILVLNGLKRWEKQYIQKNFDVHGILTLNNVGGRMISHGRIMDFLFRNITEPFGIIDADCFVFTPKVFEKITTFQDNVFINAFFQNTKGFITLPETFLLFFNTPLIQKVIEEYNVRCEETAYSQLDEKTRTKLAGIGIDERHYPDGRDFFDTMHVLFSLGIAENYHINYVDENLTARPIERDVYHVGGVTIRSKSSFKSLNETWKIRRVYFWYKTLELSGDEIVHRYQQAYGKVNPELLLVEHPEEKRKIGNDFFVMIDKIISWE